MDLCGYPEAFFHGKIEKLSVALNMNCILMSSDASLQSRHEPRILSACAGPYVLKTAVSLSLLHSPVNHSVVKLRR